MPGTSLNLAQISNLPEFDDHRLVSFLHSEQEGLRGFVAIHRGGLKKPAFGATRLWTYTNETAAIRDVLNLSKMMSYKSAMAGLGYGGAKAVLMATPETLKHKEKILKAYGRNLNYFQNHFVTGTDVGLQQSDLDILTKETKNIVGTKLDPTTYTGLGLCYALEVSLGHVFANDRIDGHSFAIQGLGKIGAEMLKHVYEHAGRIYVSDINKDRVEEIKAQYPRVEVVASTAIHKQKVDVFAPCALSYSLNAKTVSQMNCKIVLGGANNQLESPNIGELLRKLGILYGPDYVVNAGGLIAVVDEYESGTAHTHEQLVQRVSGIKERLGEIYKESAHKHKATNLIADHLAEKIFNELE